jgi:hypothetical protein
MLRQVEWHDERHAHCNLVTAHRAYTALSGVQREKGMILGYIDLLTPLESNSEALLTRYVVSDAPEYTSPGYLQSVPVDRKCLVFIAKR